MPKTPIKRSPKEAGRSPAGSRKARTQYAALPFLCGPGGELQVLLVTSRETKRWVIPKGWPMKRLPPNGAAAREAYEEAGLVGDVGEVAIGTYTYEKRLKRRGSVTCRVEVFPLRVQRQLETWPERDERTVKWFSLPEAAQAVAEPELGELILALNDNAYDPCGLGAGPAMPELAPARID